MNNRSLGVLCLCAFLILYGILALTSLTFVGAGVIEALLALAAGVLILIGR